MAASDSPAATPSDTPAAKHSNDAPARLSLSQKLFSPVDIGLLVVYRIAFGGCMLFEVYRYFAHGWIERKFINPQFYFTYYGFSWVQPFSGDGMYIVFAVLGVCAACIMIGFLYRLASIVFFLGFTYIFLLDQANYLNHFYLLSILSLIGIFLPLNRAWSIDAWLRPQIRSQTVPAWTLWLLRFQIGVAYFFGGVAKINPDWLAGVPMQIMMLRSRAYPVFSEFFEQDWAVYAYAYGGLLFDLLIVPLLLWSRTRIPAYLATVLFHASNARMFTIGIFPLIMVAASMIYFPPDWLRPDTADPLPKPDPTRKITSGQRWILAALAVFVAFQVLMPFRHWLYPGDVSWTEEGHRFSWHMKLRCKRSTAVFRAYDPDGTEIIGVPQPVDILVYRQQRKMPDRPDMVLQFAHYLADRLESEGHPNARVTADVQASLNGRDFQALIDPDADLAARPRNLWPADWIVPLHQPLPSLAEVRRQHAAQVAAWNRPQTTDGESDDTAGDTDNDEL